MALWLLFGLIQGMIRYKVMKYLCARGGKYKVGILVYLCVHFTKVVV